MIGSNIGTVRPFLFIYLFNSPCIMHITTDTYTMAGNPQQHVSQLLRSQKQGRVGARESKVEQGGGARGGCATGGGARLEGGEFRVEADRSVDART